MIKVNEQEREFHLQTNDSSYIMKVLPSGHLANLYYGKKIKNRDSFASLYQNFNIGVGNATEYSQELSPFTLDTTRLEVASYGKGDYREPSIHLLFADYSRVSDFLFSGYRVFNGKPPLQGLPAVRADDTVETLEITLIDRVRDVRLLLYYSVFVDCDVITRSLQLINGQKTSIEIEKIMSFNLDFGEADFDLITLEGKWIKERYIQRRPLQKGVLSIDSKRGVSSSENNPFLALSSKDCGETLGECYGFALVYSGNHQGLVEVSPYNLTRIQMGINPFDFRWHLDKGESFQTPEVVMTYSAQGFNKMSQNFHDLINNHLIPERWRQKERPILVNNWEATYFKFNEKKLLAIAKEAKDLGIELFVLDDGWFGERNDDTTSLGDWYVNKDKLPNGLEGLSEKLNKLGLDFGLWVEPEMVSPESKLYQEHPEWAIKLRDREPSLGRNQLMLDLSNPEVVEYLYTTLSKLFKQANIKYIKWDMNRNISDLYSASLPPERQQELAHRYVLGLYELLERLTSQFPDILFEGCASGGNRFDLGILYYMPQIWTSDNTDAIERTSIQYGTSMVYPLSTMGAHVSGSPSHQVLRHTPIETRFNVAAFGLLGYEMDLTKLSGFDKKAIKNQIAFYKKYRRLFQYGRFYRLKSPFDSNHCIWMVVSEDKREALLGYYQKLQESNGGFETIKLQGLDENLLYRLEARVQFINIKQFGSLVNDYLPVNLKEGGLLERFISDHYLLETEKHSITAYGDELMNAGFKPYNQFIGTGYNDKIRYIGDFGSRLYYLKAVE